MGSSLVTARPKVVLDPVAPQVVLDPISPSAPRVVLDPIPPAAVASPTQGVQQPDAPKAVATGLPPQSPAPSLSIAERMLDPTGTLRQVGSAVVQSIPRTAANVLGTVEALAKTSENLMAPAQRLGQAIAGRPTAPANSLSTSIGALKDAIPQPTIIAPTMKEAITDPTKFGPWLAQAIGGNALPLAATYAGARLGGVPGATGVSYLTEVGDLYNSMRAQGVDAPTSAIIAGIPMAYLNTLGPLLEAKALTREAIEKATNFALSSIPKSAAHTTAKAVAMEALPEMGQEGIAVGTERLNNINSPDWAWRLLEAGVVGGALGGGTHLANRPSTTPLPPPAQHGVDIDPPPVSPGDLSMDAGDMLVRDLDGVRIARSEEELAARVVAAAGLPAVRVQRPASDSLTVTGTPEAGAQADALEDLPDASDPTLSPQARIDAGIKGFGRVSRSMLQLRHLGWRFPSFTPIQDFIHSTDRMNTTANTWKVEGDKVLEDWRGLGTKRAKLLSEYALEVTLASDDMDRALTPEEQARIAKAGGLDDETFEVWKGMQAFFKSSLDGLRQVTLDDLSKTITDPQVLRTSIDEVNRQFDAFANKTYFPLTRFGQYTVTARRPLKGKTEIVEFETYESQRAAKIAKKRMEQRLAGKGVKVGLSELTEVERESAHIPAAVVDRLTKNLRLSTAQRAGLQQVVAQSLSQRSFLNHLKQRKGTAGFSRDGQRSFAAYVQSISNHIAKVQESSNLERTVSEADSVADTIDRKGGDAIDTKKLSQWMENQRQWIMNPKVQGNALAGAAFAWYFTYVPKQVLVNMTQVPMVTLPVLSEAVGTPQATKAILGAMSDVSGAYTKRWFGGDQNYEGGIKPHEWAWLEQAEKDGITNQTYAAQVAAFAKAAPIEKLLTSALGPDAVDLGRDVSEVIRSVTDFGNMPFSMAEEWNRRVTLLASARAYEAKGHPNPYEAAKQTVLQTQGSYEVSNRSPIQQGSLARALIFKGYLQNQLFLQRYSPAGVRLLLALAVMGGLKGITGMADLWDIFDTLGTWFKAKAGMKNPRVDIEHTIREYVNGVVGSSDWLIHGGSRLPQSLMDISGSVSMGRIVPGVDPLTSWAKGESDYKTAVVKTLEEASGVVGTQGLGMTKALMEDSPDSATFQRVMLPKALANAAAAYRAMRDKGVRSASGDKLIDIDTSNPWHWLELMGMAMGGTSPRLAQAREKKYAPTEMVRYYKLVMERAVKQYEKAIDSQDPLLIREASKELREVQATLPQGFQRTRESIMRGLHQRQKMRSLRERGLPQERRLREVYEEWSGAVK